MRKLLLVLSLLPVIALATPPHRGAQPPHGDGMHRRFMGDGEHLPPFLHDIGLSEQQQSDIKSLLKKHWAAMDEVRKNEHAIRLQLMQLSFSADFSDDKAAALIQQSLAMHQSNALEKARLDNEIYKLLTGDQQAALKTQMAKMADDKPF